MDLRILLVDDHQVVRLGVRALIDDQEGMRVVGEAGTVREAIGQAKELRPDVVVLDVRLPDGSGVDACRRIKADLPETRVVILTSFSDDQVIMDAIACGADGFVLKQIGSNDLIEALRRVGRGESLLDPLVTDKVFARMREMRQHEWAQAFANLTLREMQILNQVTQGRTNREIGDELSLSEKTVRNYVSGILTKLNLTSRAEAAAYAARHRIEEYVD